MAVLRVDAESTLDAARADVEAMGASFDDLGRDARSAGDDVRNASLDLDSLGEGADNVSSRSSQAAGAMGDLAGGLDLIGASGAATALEGIGVATMVAAGAGDVLNLVAETSVGKWIANTAAQVAHRTATIAGAAATGIMTGAQAALNAVMSANPLALVVIAILALVAGFILAYKHSETFRNIVDGAFSRARDVIEGAGDAVAGFVDWLRGLPADARDAWDRVAGAVDDAVDDARRFFGDLIDDVKRLPRDAVSSVAGSFTSMFAPIADAVEWVKDLVDRIKDIDFPDFPDVPFLRQADPLGDLTLGGGAPVINLTINAQAAPFDPEAWIENLFTDLREFAARRGYTLVLTTEGIPA